MRERLLLIVGFLGCGGTTAPPPVAATPPPPAAQPVPAPPGLRLSTDVTPKKYTLDLNLDPARTDFDGSVDIDVDVKVPAEVIWLHAEGLTVKNASVGDKPARTVTPDPEHLGLVLEAPASGATRIHIAYAGKFSANETRGFFREEEDGNAYVFSHFESTHARKAYPCFDEPSWKAPFALTMHIPANLVGLENMPVASETVDGATKTLKFVDTPPLPTYLFALGVGPFDLVDGGTSKSGVPVRLAAPKGRGAEGEWAAKVIPPILDVEEEYFGQKYPFAKLDILSVPKSTEFGAEENPGLITVVEAIALGRPGNSSEALQHLYGAVMAHEVAHMWFGDSVTPSWWNDIWLNESFASWFAPKVIKRWQPTWGAEVGSIEARNAAMAADVLKSARAIRQPIASPADIANAFDGITYQKGEAVLTMFETWVGEDKFQTGVRKYVADKKYGSGSTEDFLATIGAAAGRDVAKPFATFIDQAGVPLVTMKLNCAKGKATLALAQRRHVLAGIEPDTRTWQIPICVRTDGGKSACTLMTEATAELELPGGCPAWIEPNVGGHGYYRVLLEGDLAGRLAKNAKKLTDPERLANLSDLAALGRAGVMPDADVMAALPSYGLSDNASFAQVAIGFLEAVHDDLLPAGAEADFEKLIDRLFGARARALGFEAKKSDDYEVRRLRRVIVEEVATRTGDAKLVAEARRLADRWLADKKSIDPDLAATALQVVGARADKATVDRLIQDLNATSDLRDRGRLFAALGNVRDPAAVDAVLALLLDEKIDIRESSGLLRDDIAAAAESRDRVRAFIRANWDALVKRYPSNFVVGLMRAASNVCDDAGEKEFTAFFQDKAQKMEGGPRLYESAVERIRGCKAVAAIQRPSVAAYFKK